MDALRRARAQGGLEDRSEMKIQLGIAYSNAGDKRDAANSFGSIGKNSMWHELAELRAHRTAATT